MEKKRKRLYSLEEEQGECAAEGRNKR